MSGSNFTPPKPGHKTGGYKFHKPGCNCLPCRSRRRKEEALAGGAGDGGESLETAPAVVEAVPEEVGLEIPSDGPLHAELDPLTIGGRSARDRVAQWIYYRSTEPGITNVEIARRLGLSTATLNTILSKARRSGLLKTDDPLTKIELDLIPKAVENLQDFLDAKDKKVTIEFAKGVLFPAYRESKGIQENNTTILGIKIELPEDGAVQRRGAISGTPRSVGPKNGPTDL